MEFPTMRTCDSHIHLDRLYAPVVPAEHRVLVPGIDIVGTKAALEQYGEDPGVDIAVALHPWYLHSAAADWPDVEQLADDPRVCAVGETGLDHARHRGAEDRGTAELWFRNHIALAVSTDKPLIVHCVRAHGRCEEILREHGNVNLRGVIHAYSGSLEMAMQYRRVGMFIGVGPIVLRPNARMRRAAQLVPIDMLLLETDAPYMSVAGSRVTHVDQINLVAEAVAELRGISVGELWDAVCENYRNLFEAES